MNSRNYWWIAMLVVNMAAGQTIVDDFTPRLRFSAARFVGEGFATAETSDGGILLGGNFDYLNGRESGTVIKLNQDGSPFPGFQKVITDGNVKRIHVLPTGKIIILGSFTTINGNASSALSRLNNDGSFDITFQNTPQILNFDVQSSGDIIILTNDGKVSRLKPDGTKDQGFADYDVGTIGGFVEIDNDDLIYTGWSQKISRLNKNGTLDAGFTTVTLDNGSAFSVLPLHDGTLVIGGNFAKTNGTSKGKLVRINHDGSINSTFSVGSGIEGEGIYAMSESNSGNVLIAGQILSYDGTAANSLEIDLSGDIQYVLTQSGYSSSTYSIYGLSNGRTLIGGTFTSVNGIERYGVAMIDADYTLSQIFKPLLEASYGSYDYKPTPPADNQNSLVVFPAYDQNPDMLGIYNGTTTVSKSILRIDAAGNYDPSFSITENIRGNYISSTIQPDNKILLTGAIFHNNFPAHIIRFLPDGSIDNSFHVEPGDGSIIRTAVVNDGNIYIGGYFSTINGSPTNGVAILNEHGDLVSAFSTLPANADVFSIKVLPDKSMLVVYQINVNTILVKLSQDGSIDGNFSPVAFGGGVFGLEVDTAGRIYCGGTFPTVNGASRKGLVRLTPQGTIDNTFITGSGFGTGYILDIALLPNGNIMAGGWFSSYRGNAAHSLVVIGPSGGFVPSPGIPLNNGSTIQRLSKANEYIFAMGRIVLNDFQKIISIAKIDIESVSIPLQLSGSVSSDGVVHLTWTDANYFESGFSIEASADDDQHFAQIGTVPKNTLSYTRQLDPDKVYYFRVRPLGNHPYQVSNQIEVIWNATPSAPTMLTGALINNSLKLQWIDNSDNELDFNIERSTDGSNFTSIATVNSNINTAFDNIDPLIIYYYKVSAYNGVFKSSPTNIFQFSWDGLPAAPSLAVTLLQENFIKVRWQDNSFNEDAFIIQRRTLPGGAFADISSVSAGVDNYVDGNVLFNNRYAYRIASKNTYGISEFSNETEISTIFTSLAPSSLTGSLSDATLILNWTDNADNEDGFIVERAVGTPTDFIIIQNLDQNTTTYSDLIDPLNTYFYRVRSFNAAGSSIPSSLFSFKWDGIPTAPLFTAAVLQNGPIKLTWQDNSFNEDSFVVQRKSSLNGIYATIDNVGSNVVEYTDGSTLFDNQYVYRIAAKNVYGISAYSNEIEISSLVTPIAPSNLTGTLSNATLTLNWSDNSSNESGFSLERSVGNPSGFTVLQNLAQNETSYSDVIDPGVIYYYRIHSFNGPANSPNSLIFSFTWDGIPASPSSLTVTLENNSIRLNWQDNSFNESAFLIQRKNIGEPSFTTVSSVTAGIITSLDNSVSFNSTYLYRIAANNINGSSYSNEAQISTLSTPAAPTSLVVSVSGSGFMLNWSDHATNEAGFVIERKLNNESNFAVVTTSAAPNMNSYQDNAVAVDKIYEYRVAAINAAGKSAYSNIVVTPLILGIEDDLTDLKVYPNPVTDKVTIEMKNIVGIQLVDTKGAYLTNEIRWTDNNQAYISTTNLLPGLYILILNSERGTIVRKIVKM